MAQPTGVLRRTWWEDVRHILGLNQWEMADALGIPRRTYQRYEARETVATLTVYLRARELLAARDVDSRGKLRVGT